MKRWIFFLMLALLLLTACNKYYVQIEGLEFSAEGQIYYEVTNPTLYDLECEIQFKDLGQHVFEIQSNTTQTYNFTVDMPEQVKTNVLTRCKPII